MYMNLLCSFNGLFPGQPG